MNKDRAKQKADFCFCAKWGGKEAKDGGNGRTGER